MSQNTEAMRRAALRKKEEQRKREERNRIATIAVIVCSVVAVLAIGAFLLALFNGALLNKEKDLVEVPYLVGTMYSDDLVDKYSDFKFRYQPQQYDDTYQKGQIMLQEPEGGSKVTKGTEIVITVSLGEEPVVKIMEDLREVGEETGLDVSACPHRLALTYARQAGGGDNYFVDVYVFECDFDPAAVRCQPEETDGFALATPQEIAALAGEGIFLHYDSIKSVFEA